MRRSRPISHLALIAVIGVLAALCAPASAQVTLYTNRAAFLAATAGTTNIDFEGIAPAGSFVDYGGGPLVLSGVTFTGNADMSVVDSGYYSLPYKGAFLTSQFSDPFNVITAALPTGVTAIGADIGGLFDGSQTFTITLSTGDTFVVPTTNTTSIGSLDFAGFTSKGADITSIVFNTPASPTFDAIDNVTFGRRVAAVPEASSMALLAGGIFPVLMVLRRRKR